MKNQPQANYLQVGKAIECGHCHPEKFAEGLKEAEKMIPNFKCDCICHKPESQKWGADINEVIEVLEDMERRYGKMKTIIYLITFMSLTFIFVFVLGMGFFLQWFAGLPGNDLSGLNHIGPIEAYPNPKLTLGIADTTDYNTLVATYAGQTYSQHFRNVLESTKQQVMKNYPDARKPVEIDHFIPLCLGGANDVRNLWAEPEVSYMDGKNYGYRVKDTLESYLCLQMKSGKISPKDAQDKIRNDWVKSYNEIFNSNKNLGSFLVEDDDEIIQ